MICLTAVIEGKGRNRSRPVASFAIRQEWWTGEALPEPKVVRRELAGVAKVEVVGRSKEKVEERSSGTRSPRRGPTWPESRGNKFRCFVRRMDRNGHRDSTLPPLSVMIAAWTDAIWNGSATTS